MTVIEGDSRSPHGERGLKYPEVEVAVAAYDVAPRTGAWIEIPTGGVAPEPSNASPPARGAWIEICSRLTWAYLGFSSLPARGAWIEISQRHLNSQ